MKRHNIYQDNIYRHIIMSVLFIIVISSTVGLFIHGSRLFSSFAYYMKYTSFGYVIGIAFFGGHTLIGYYTEKKLNWTKNPKKANIISLLMYIIYGLVVCSLIPNIFYRFVWGFSGQDLFINVLIMSLMIFSLDMIVISIFYSTYLAKYWKKAIEKNAELKRENLLAKYEALKNQVNPHFLFNSLNTLSGVVEQKPELATSFIKKLSDIYRYVLEQSDQEMVSINDEVKFVDDYIFLLKMRFGEALIFNSDLSAISNTQIAPLGLQMLVENAIKHNVISDDMPLKIEIGIDEGFIMVRNNMQKKKTIISDNEPLGLDNLKKRYAYLSDSLVEIIKSDSEFIVKLPIIES
jgi:sensor histidine kinase YesM